MRNKLILLVAPLMLAAAFAAQPSSTPPRLDFPDGGFSIAPFDTAPSDATLMPLIMSEPASTGFAPNVNVMIQPFAKPMSDFVSLSESQFKQISATVISEKTQNPNEWNCEYEATINGKKMHFYAHAISANSHVYISTGTATEDQWAAAAEKIKSCVDSLQVKATPAITVPSLLK